MRSQRVGQTLQNIESHSFWDRSGYGSKLGTPKLWMVNTKLDIHICGPTSVFHFDPHPSARSHWRVQHAMVFLALSWDLSCAWQVAKVTRRPSTVAKRKRHSRIMRAGAFISMYMF